MEHAHRTPAMMERNMPCVPHVDHHTLSRCWFALRTKYEPMPLPTEPEQLIPSLAHPPQTMLHFLIDNGEDLVQGSPNLANWNALQQLIKAVYPTLPSGELYYRAKPSLPALAKGLHAACSEGNVTKMNDILRMDPDYINYPSKTGDFPLICAAQGGHLNAAYLALQNGAIPDAPDASGNTALHYAASGGHVRLAELLLDCHGESALQMRMHLRTIECVRVNTDAPLARLQPAFQLPLPHPRLPYQRRMAQLMPTAKTRMARRHSILRAVRYTPRLFGKFKRHYFMKWNL